MTTTRFRLPAFYGNPIDTPVGHRWAGEKEEGTVNKKKYSVVVRASFLGEWHEVEQSDELIDAKAASRLRWLAGNYEARVRNNETGEFVGNPNGF